eukprot:GEMP01042881.1.p1 GENE.GEMP01042881.1~~GEMP01042881.1.p1  ORF type:complete len:223 (+),score=27.47 GEMP01042881.1:22-669(+)
MPFKPLSQRLNRDLVIGGENLRTSGICVLLDPRTISWPPTSPEGTGYMYARHPATLGFHLPKGPLTKAREHVKQPQEEMSASCANSTMPRGFFRDAPPPPPLESESESFPTISHARSAPSLSPAKHSPKVCTSPFIQQHEPLINFPKYMGFKDSHMRRRDLKHFGECLTKGDGEPLIECRVSGYDWDPNKMFRTGPAGHILPSGRACKTSNPFVF